MRNGMNSIQSISIKNLIWESVVSLALFRKLMEKVVSSESQKRIASRPRQNGKKLLNGYIKK